VDGYEERERLSRMGGRVGAAFSLFRLLRAFRLIRLNEGHEISDFFVKTVRSERLIHIASILEYVILFLGLTHLIACAWYGVGTLGGNVSSSWVKSLRLQDEPLGERYAWAIHCALALYSGGEVVMPMNIGERAFMIVALALTFMISVWIVSSITTSMTRLQIIAGERSAQFSALSRYLSDNSISRQLVAKVQRNAQHAVQEQKRNAPEGSIELLALVSEPLRVELRFELNSPALSSHPFFGCFMKVHPQGIRQICYTAISRLSFSAGDIVFSVLEEPQDPKMYFVNKGCLIYEQQANLRQVKLDDFSQWLAESVLWTEWVHRGVARAFTDIELLAIRSTQFGSIATKFPGNHVRSYADEYVKILTCTEEFDLTDLGGDSPDLAYMICCAFPEQTGGKRNTINMHTAGQILSKSPRHSQEGHANGEAQAPGFLKGFSSDTLAPTSILPDWVTRRKSKIRTSINAVGALVHKSTDSHGGKPVSRHVMIAEGDETDDDDNWPSESQ